MFEETQALQEQENLPIAAVDEIPEKFRGKSADEIIDMYRNLETDYGRKGQLLGEYAQRLAQYEQATEAEADSAYTPDEMTLARCLPMAQAEYQRLVQLGAPESEELQAQAWQFAQGQDEYLQAAIAQGVQAHLAPYAAAMMPGVYAPDVQSVLEALPVQGISADEVVAEISQAGIPPMEWAQADPEQKLHFIVAAAKQLAYDRMVGGQYAVAPAQIAPGVLGNSGGRMSGDPEIERQVMNIMRTMGLKREAAEEVMRGA